jgi:putative ABC transport system substrate-binding protein
MQRLAVALLISLVLALLTAPLAAEAQTAGRVYRVGYLGWRASWCADQALKDGLRELGYVEGRNLAIECRDAGGRYDRLPAAAAELVGLKVDVIVALSHANAFAAKAATATIPIVMLASGEPVAAGLVASLARPGGNMTGLTYYATELSAKRLELLKEVAPRVARVAVMDNPTAAYLNFPFLRDTERAAQVLGLQLHVMRVGEPNEVERVFTLAAKEGVDALFVLPDLMFSTQAKQIAELAMKHRWPTMAWGKWFAHEGALMAYAADYADLGRRAAVYVDKILKGRKPADLPVEQPTKFQLIINLKTAKALGLTIPQSVLARADEVIQ